MSSKFGDTRTRILEATWKLMEDRHGQGVRMTDIAKAAGVSRQALYLHFATRAELLIATTRYIDAVKGVEERLIPSRTASSGEERLDALIEFWASYIPEIHGVATALLAAYDTDEAAAEAWDQRMLAMREGCEAAITALDQDGQLSSDWAVQTATDLLWTMLSVRNWNQLTGECGWTAAEYAERLQCQAKQSFVENSEN